MLRTLRTDWQVVKADGQAIYTFDCPERAKAWAKACGVPGVTVEEVQVLARRIYRPRPVAARPDPFAIPPMPVRA
ncbi:hypothetical protein Q0812_13210 [Brevundimonas sp. 2R-24]|uniref:Uncharacterized protein n=1 Tax=Peiella sedimenti TaxID=3061083 RepID=A0ABT8SP84_9CAUL|nr:hypothetical protein [Caulobacteraceae bacterium XZ-24]